MFTKQHYRAIANAIKEADAGNNIINKHHLVSLLCYHFKLDNSRFNPTVFQRACGEEVKDAKVS